MLFGILFNVSSITQSF